METNLETQTLFLNDNVVIYKNLFKNPKIIVDILKKTENKEIENTIFENWSGWFHFGTQVTFPFIPDLQIDDILGDCVEKFYRDPEPGEDLQQYAAKAISNAFYISTQDYIKKNNIQLPAWEKMGIAVCKYNRDGKDYAMSYHTDYGQGQEDDPGYKFAITCTMYLNDDYRGGELRFLDKVTKQVVEYTPFAGDVVVFPSGNPVYPMYHGVGKIYEGDKYFVRLFWGWNAEGSKEWHENSEKYGKDEWKKIRTEQIKQDMWYGKYHYDVVWDEKDLEDPKYEKSTERPNLTPIYSPYPLIKVGKGQKE